MNIILSQRFKDALNDIVAFIAQDSPKRARDFRDKIFVQIRSLVFMPYRCRKNAILGDENVRDLIFKGYVVSYRINKESIEILLIYKENLPRF